jgi:hypothetical protein
MGMNYIRKNRVVKVAPDDFHRKNQRFALHFA